MSRKTPRKSKLLPRSVDESTKLQSEELDFEALIDNSAKNSNTERQFNVTVAVEKVHDNVDLYKNPSVEHTQNSSYVDISKKENVCHEKSIKSSQHYIVDRENILEAANKLAQTNNIADKLLAIEVSNCLGLFQKYVPTSFEKKLQTVFDQWNDWQKLITMKFRSFPLMYKCYICRKAWWHFFDFREHLYQHDSFSLKLEEYTSHEANIIAYSNVEEIVDINKFSTDGDCPKCGNDFVIHLNINRSRKCYYSCKVVDCTKKFPTCFLLYQHENTNHTLMEGTTNTCELCGICCTENDYKTHMTTMHSVRSDVVVPYMHKKCKYCQAPYEYERLHICMKSAYVDKICDFCYRISSSTGKHYNTNIGCICKICNIGLPRQCMEAEHLLKHTTNFVMVKKCLLCDEFKVFLDDASATSHQITTHMTWDSQTSRCITMYAIIIPISCLKPENVSSPVKTLADTENVMPAIENIKPNREKTPPAIKNTTSGGEQSYAYAHVIVKFESQVTSSQISAPVLEIKQEIMDDLQSSTDYNMDSMNIKEEINYEDDFSEENNYSLENENNKNNLDNVYGINIEHMVKQEQNELEQSDIEDDIIRLDFNYPIQDNTEMKSQETLEETIQKCLETTEQMYPDKIQEDDEESVEEIVQSKTRKQAKQYNYSLESDKEKKKPKLYSCKKCGIHVCYRQYVRHKDTVCPRKERVDRNTQPGTYKCTKCKKKFYSLNAYGKHFTVHDYEPKTCPVCSEVFPQNSNLQWHLSGHIKKMFRHVRVLTSASSSFYNKCTVCEEEVENNKLFEHWESHLRLDIQYTAIKKEKEDANNSGSVAPGPMDDSWLQIFLKRLQSPDRNKTKRCCMICNRYFSRRNDCKRHMIEHLLNDALAKTAIYNAIKCQICGKGFKHPPVYKKHMRDHAYLPIYKCVICDKTFSDSSNFAKHKKLHNTNAYVCDTCGRKFQAKVSIERHVKIHETLEPLVCEPCNKTFYFRSSLNRHNKSTHHSNIKRFRCTFCHERFHTLKEKWDHLWHLHKERKSRADCKFCEKSYRKFSELKGHLKEEHVIVWHKMNQISKPTRKNYLKLLTSVKNSIIRSQLRGESRETLVVVE